MNTANRPLQIKLSYGPEKMHESSRTTLKSCHEHARKIPCILDPAFYGLPFCFSHFHYF